MDGFKFREPNRFSTGRRLPLGFRVYDEECLEAFREEYADMPIHKKGMRNKFLPGGGVVVTLLAVIGFLIITIGVIQPVAFLDCIGESIRINSCSTC